MKKIRGQTTKLIEIPLKERNRQKAKKRPFRKKKKIVERVQKVPKLVLL